MAVNAVRLLAVNCTRTRTAKGVDLGSYRLQVKRIDAGMNSAAVIQYQPVRNRPHGLFISKAMGEVVTRPKTEDSIACTRVDRRLPQPARRSQPDLGPEPDVSVHQRKLVCGPLPRHLFVQSPQESNQRNRSL